jgi:hypothetical protein
VSAYGKAIAGIDSKISGEFELAAQRTTLAAMASRALEKEFNAGGKQFDELQKDCDA